MDRHEFLSNVGKLITAPLSRDGWIRHAPLPVSGWTESRDFPALVGETFGQRFAKRYRNQGGD